MIAAFYCVQESLVTVFRQAGDDRAVAVHPLLLNAPFFKGLEQGAARFAIMFAVAETAGSDQIIEFDEASFDIGAADMAQAELANPRGVDQVAATWEVEQARSGRGVSALTRKL